MLVEARERVGFEAMIGSRREASVRIRTDEAVATNGLGRSRGFEQE